MKITKVALSQYLVFPSRPILMLRTVILPITNLLPSNASLSVIASKLVKLTHRSALEVSTSDGITTGRNFYKPAEFLERCSLSPGKGLGT